MALLLALLGGLVAGDGVELEELKVSPGNTWGCNLWSALANESSCKASPFCKWYGNNGVYKCYDDPCLKVMKTGESCLASVPVEGSGVSESVPCAEVTTLAPRFTGADCTGEEVVNLCAQSPNTNLFDYCTYAKLRDGTCPDSVCRETDPYSQNSQTGQCVQNNETGCAILRTPDQCGLVPKCYWKSNSEGCVKDPCFTQESLIPGGGVCANYKPVDGVTCKEFKPFTVNGAGSVSTYCVISANSKPNLCYLGTPGADTSSDDDYQDTYPTLSFGTNGALVDKPSCSETASSCNNMGTCVVVVNKKGALAGSYCSDGEHGAANVLHIPSVLVVILAALFALFNF